MKNLLAIFLLLVSCFTVRGQSNNVTYSGKINGFNPSWNFNSGTLIVKNMVTQLTESYIIPIDQQGNFSTEFFLDHNQECWVGFPFFNSTVYFGQDKHIIQDFDVTEPPAVTHVFKGDFAQINNDINKVRSFLAPDWEQIYKDVYPLSAEQFKAYFLKIKEHKINQLNSIRKSAGMDDKAYDLAYRTISYSIASSLNDINSIRESAFRRQHNLSFENRDPMAEPLKLQAAYYSFLKDLPYND
ncbi:MAG: TlpA family protein disulfide reductase, partial [Sphingobacterium sp.]